MLAEKKNECPSDYWKKQETCQERDSNESTHLVQAKKRENMNIYLTSTKSNYYKTIPTMAGTCFSHCSAYQTDQLCVHKDINIAVTVRVSMNVHGSDSCWRLNNFKNTQTYPNMCAKKQYCLI